MTIPERLVAGVADRYRIERELGAGGMATVYLADDIRHHRKVALKVLRPELSAVIGAERFLVEIRTTANLQHPNILPLYDSGQVDGTVFYVMPFVEGESLRDRLDRDRQLPVSDAIRIASEVAGALDYAHRHGVIHRDIKPENILLQDGRALIADFGIALAASQGGGGSRLTETGMSLGTPHYMSPEQALGERSIDARADVYALGCVLHEMLTGEPPFTGPTAQAIIARVMSGEPEPVRTLRKTVPEHVEDAILTALAKLPADRFASAAEFGNAIVATESYPARSGATRSARASAKRSLRTTRLLWPVATATLLVVALWGWLRPTAAAEQIPSRLAILTPGLGDAGAGLQRMIDITPDGRSLLYINVAEGETRIMRRRLEDAEAVPLAGSQRQIAGIYISRDAREYFTVDPQTGQMLRFPTDGGNPRPLPAGLAVAAYAAWGSDGTLWLSPQSDRARGVARVTSEGAVDYPLRALSDLNVVQILPGDKHAIAVRSPIGTAFGPAFIVDLQAVEATPILGVDVVEIKYVKGLLVYVLPNGTMEAVRFDIDDGRTLGRPVTIANGVGLTGFGQAHLAVSENGTVAYIPDEPRSLILVDRAGNARPATAERRNFHIPRFSPDGRRILVDFNGVDGRDVWLLDVPDGTLSRVTLDRDGHDATWGPGDGDVTYSSAIRGGGQLGIYRTRPGRGAEMDTIISDPSLSYPGVWLPDRSGLVTAGNSIQSESRSDIALVQNSGRGPIVPLVASRFDEMYPSVSRDGRWLAYTSDQSGRIEVYVRPIASGGEQLQVSAGGGTEPMWGVRGELFYRAPAAGGSQLIAASLSLSATPIVSSRQRLFDVTDIVTSSPHANYDVSPDGRTFAMVRQNPATRIVIIQNLPALVRQLEDGATGR